MITIADRLTFTTTHKQRPAIADQPVGATTFGKASLAATCQIITTREQFDALELEWNQLHREAGDRSTIFQSFNWHWHWCNHFLPCCSASSTDAADLQLYIVTVRRAGKLRMIWPLALQRRAAIRRLVWIGAPVSQYGDVIANPDRDTADLLQQSWAFIKNNSPADLIYLRKIRADAMVAPFLKRQGAVALECQEAVSQDLSSVADYDTYAARHSTKARRNRRRQLRRLEEQGAVTFKIHPPGPRARTIALDAIAMKRVWLAEKGLVSRAYSDPRFDAFFADIALAASHPTGCSVSELTCGDSTAAVEIGLDDGNSRLMHIIVYNLEFERFGAGAQHMIGTIKHCIERNLKRFDLLAPNTRYKREWADRITDVCDYADGNTPTGWIFLWSYLKILRPAAKAIIARLPTRLSRLLAPRSL